MYMSVNQGFFYLDVLIVVLVTPIKAKLIKLLSLYVKITACNFAFSLD